MEKRRESRYAAQGPVRITLLRDPPQQLAGRLSNLSGGGLRLLTEQPLPEGAPVQIEFDELTLLGEVCYCRPAGPSYAAGVKLEHCFTLTEDLLRLARQLSGETTPLPDPRPG